MVSDYHAKEGISVLSQSGSTALPSVFRLLPRPESSWSCSFTPLTVPLLQKGHSASRSKAFTQQTQWRPAGDIGSSSSAAVCRRPDCSLITWLMDWSVFNARETTNYFRFERTFNFPYMFIEWLPLSQVNARGGFCCPGECGKGTLSVTNMPQFCMWLRRPETGGNN